MEIGALRWIQRPGGETTNYSRGSTVKLETTQPKIPGPIHVVYLESDRAFAVTLNHWWEPTNEPGYWTPTELAEKAWFTITRFATYAEAEAYADAKRAGKLLDEKDRVFESVDDDTIFAAFWEDVQHVAYDTNYEPEDRQREILEGFLSFYPYRHFYDGEPYRVVPTSLENFRRYATLKLAWSWYLGPED
jgi:hypothetical protein